MSFDILGTLLPVSNFFSTSETFKFLIGGSRTSLSESSPDDSDLIPGITVVAEVMTGFTEPMIGVLSALLLSCWLMLMVALSNAGSAV